MELSKRVHALLNLFSDSINELDKTSDALKFHRELRQLVLNPDPEKEYMLMSRIGGQDNFTVHLYQGEVVLPSQEAYGVLDRNGRQAKHYFDLPDSTDLRKSKIYPSVIMPGIHQNGVIYRADYLFNPDSTLRMETWFVRARFPEDNAIINPKRIKSYSEPVSTIYGKIIKPQDTADANNGVY